MSSAKAVTPVDSAAVREPGSVPLGEVASLFLKLGTIGFGGPAAHIALMEDEVVRRRRWISREDFLDLVAASNLIPGPNSTELAIHLGHRAAGWRGLAVAGLCFILPAVFIVSAIGWLYLEYGSMPQAAWLLYGVKPVIIAVVLQALWGLGKSALKTVPRAILAVAALALSLLGVDELAVLFGAGALWAAGRWVAARREAGARGDGGSPALALVPMTLPGADAAGQGAGAATAIGTVGGSAAGSVTGSVTGTVAVTVAGTAAGSAAFGLLPLFLFFLKVGSVIYGSGYVLLAFLESDLVERFGWLTRAQLLDAVAVGQVTPGPVFTTATFIGYVLGGPAAAAVATVGIFLPAFFFVAVSGPLIPRIRRSPVAGAALDGVVTASLALMAAVTLGLGRAAVVDAVTAALAVVSAVLLVRFRLNSMWLVAGGALAGLVFKSL